MNLILARTDSLRSRHRKNKTKWEIAEIYIFDSLVLGGIQRVEIIFLTIESLEWHSVFYLC
jgi:hypothetical protein